MELKELNRKNDLTQKYSKGTIAIHWITTILILILFPLGKYMADLPAEEKMGMIKVHAILGILILLLTLIRSWYYFKKKRPADIKTGSKFNDKLVTWIHNIFYFLLFGIAFSGIATMIAGGYGDALQASNFEFINERSQITPLKPHGILATIMMLLLLMHVLGVLKHYIFTKENTLKRIF
jgi:cytochrome b561